MKKTQNICLVVLVIFVIVVAIYIFMQSKPTDNQLSDSNNQIAGQNINLSSTAVKNQEEVAQKLASLSANYSNLSTDDIKCSPNDCSRIYVYFDSWTDDNKNEYQDIIREIRTEMTSFNLENFGFSMINVVAKDKSKSNMSIFHCISYGECGGYSQAMPF